MPSHKSEDYKISAVKYFLVANKTQEQVCQIFKCSVRSLMRWIDRYDKENSIKRHNREPIAYKVSHSNVKFIIEEIKKNKTITIDDLLLQLNNKFPDLDLSKMHVHRIIKDNNITLKLTRLRHEPKLRFGKEIDINKRIKEFYNEVKKYKLEDIICIDETSINALQLRHHCYNTIGKRCVIKTSSQEIFKKYTAIFAISVNGVEGWILYDKGGINSERLYEFLEKYITKKYKKKLIILDNASSHRNQTIKELINKKNTLLHSVPYQHYTNAIEGYFNVLKSRLQKLNGLSHDKIKENITKVVKDIPIEIYKNLFKGSYKRPEVFVKKVSKRVKKLKNYL